GANVVRRVAEVGIDLDSAFTLADGALDVAGMRISPTEESVRLGGGAGLDGAPVQLAGGAQLSSAVPLEALPPQLDGLGSSVRCGHATFLAGSEGLGFPRGAPLARRIDKRSDLQIEPPPRRLLRACRLAQEPVHEQVGQLGRRHRDAGGIAGNLPRARVAA